MANKFDKIFKRGIYYFADLRNLQPLLTKIMDDMPITYNIRRDIRYKQGKLEAELATHQSFVIRLLTKGIQSVETIADFVGVDIDFVIKTKSSYEKAISMANQKKYTVQDIVRATDLQAEVVEKWVMHK